MTILLFIPLYMVGLFYRLKMCLSGNGEAIMWPLPLCDVALVQLLQLESIDSYVTRLITSTESPVLLLLCVRLSVSGAGAMSINVIRCPMAYLFRTVTRDRAEGLFKSFVLEW